MQRILIVIVILIALAVGGYFGVTYWLDQQAAAELANYQTTSISRGSLVATVGATGVVRSNQSTVLSWQTSGTVAEVAVQAGDLVEAGQVLAVLQEGSLAQSVILARSDLINAQKALDDLQNSTTAQVQAQQAVAAARQAVIEAERLLDPYEVQDFADDLDDARAEVVDAEEALQEAVDDFEPYKDFDPDNADRKRFEEALEDAQQDYDEAVRKLELLELEKQQAQTNLELANARLADAQREADRLQSGPDPDEVAVLEARIAAAQATLDLVQLEATFPGTVTDVQVKPGDQAAPGKVAFRLDDLSRLLVDVRVSEVDINRVALGQNARLTFDAILGREYNGVVTQIANIGAATQGAVEFLVTVELTDFDELVRPGMTAAVNIIFEELDNVLLVNNRAVRLLDGQRVVYVLRSGELTPVRVTLGASSDLESEVLEGDLRAGDVIVLNPPQVFDTNGPPPFVRR